jgi:four helix bundle protein
MQGYKDLVVWQKSMSLVVLTYEVTQAFPTSELYGLAWQMQRAAVSIPSNIAEGHRLKQTPAYLRHLALAAGSLCELETQLEIARRLGYVPPEYHGLIRQANEIARMLFGLRQSLQARRNSPNPEP